MKKRNKTLVAILTIFFNSLGIPHFIHGQVLAGIATIWFGVFTFGIGFVVNFFVGLVKGIRLLKMSPDTYDSLEMEQILAGVPRVSYLREKEHKTWIAVVMAGIAGMIIPMFDVYRLLCEYVVQDDKAIDIYRWLTSPIAQMMSDNKNILNLISNVESLFAEYLAVPLTILIVVLLAVAFVVMLRFAIWGIQILLNTHKSNSRSALLVWGWVVTAANFLYVPRCIIRGFPLLGIGFPRPEGIPAAVPAWIEKWFLSWVLPIISTSSTVIRYTMYALLVIVPIVFTIALVIVLLILTNVPPQKGNLEESKVEESF